jgi:hypothetical protein
MSTQDHPGARELAERITDGARALMYRAEDYLRRSTSGVSEERRARLAEAVELVERALERLS